MRVLLATIGTRGDVQPLVGLALELRRLGQEVRLCVPPDFLPWLDKLGLPAVPIGPSLRELTATPAAPALRPPTPEQRRRLAEASVAAQFTTVSAAAEDCDLIVAATALQIAARTVAEARKIPYVFTAYCPAVLPSPHHAPAVTRPPEPGLGNVELWDRERDSFTNLFGPALNTHRAALGLNAIDDVLAHILGDRPLLAADPALAPWPGPNNPGPDLPGPGLPGTVLPGTVLPGTVLPGTVLPGPGLRGPGVPGGGSGLWVRQTGAWLVSDDGALSPELEAFLDAGEPPIYFGIGSMRAPAPADSRAAKADGETEADRATEARLRADASRGAAASRGAEVGRAMVAAARAVGRRVVLSRGWGELTAEDAPDCLVIGDVNHRALFPRVAAVVHHGGAGTTTAAALGGAPQVVIPQTYDQYYWADRVRTLGVGCRHAPGEPTGESLAESLAAALNAALAKPVADRASKLSTEISLDGATLAAAQLLTESTQHID